MSNTTQHRPISREEIRSLFLAFIIGGSIYLLLTGGQPFWIKIASIVGLFVLFSSVIFKKFAQEHALGFNLLTELVAVILGIYLGIHANDLAINKSEKKQLLKIVKTTKTDLEECINKLTFESEKSDSMYLNSDTLFLIVRRSDLRHVFETPDMYDYLINNPTTIKFFPPEMVRRMIAINTFDKQIAQHLNTCVYPGLKEYKSDLSTIAVQLSRDLEILDLQIDYLVGDIRSEDELLERLKRYQSIRLIELYIPLDWP